MAEPVKVLFVCMGNCVRSQMAEAIARHDASDIIAPESAGVHPLGFIDNTTQRVLRERGISFHGQFSKGTRDHSLQKPDLIVNMSGISGDSLFAGLPFEDWQIQDPFGEAIELHRSICDDIGRHIVELAARLRRSQPGRQADAGSRTDNKNL